MAPEVAVVDSEVKADDIQIGDDGTDRSGHPDALRGTGPAKACADAEGGYCV
jgi:hypothetical protein